MENIVFSIDNLASADLSFGVELKNRLFLINVINLIIASSIKTLIFIENTSHDFSLICSTASVKTSSLQGCHNI